MLNIFFFVKALALTVLFVIFLQVKVSGVTLEVHATRFITTSMLTEPIRYTAESGARVIQTGVSWVSKKINGTLRWRRGDDGSSFRSNPFKLNRSENYKKDQQAAEEAAPSTTSSSR